jgi:hypothetical protein
MPLGKMQRQARTRKPLAWPRQGAYSLESFGAKSQVLIEKSQIAAHVAPVTYLVHHHELRTVHVADR